LSSREFCSIQDFGENKFGAVTAEAPAAQPPPPLPAAHPHGPGGGPAPAPLGGGRCDAV